MTRFDARTRALAICLSAVAGYIDGIGFLATGGFFVSFMSGNSTRLAVGTAQHSAVASTALGLIVVFVAGVTGGSLIGRVLGAHRRSGVPAGMAAVLAVAALLGTAGQMWPAIALMAFTMGAENTVFEEDGEVRLGLTYMTGTLVKLGQRIATALLGGSRWGWVPHLGLWVGLVTGAILGAAVFQRFGFAALWMAVVALLLVAVAARALHRPVAKGFV